MTIYWDATRPGEADLLAHALARELVPPDPSGAPATPPAALVGAEVRGFRLLPLLAPGQTIDIDTSESREASEVRLDGERRLLPVLERGSQWRSFWVPSRALELHTLDTLEVASEEGPRAARPGGWVTRQRLWVRLP